MRGQERQRISAQGVVAGGCDVGSVVARKRAAALPRPIRQHGLEIEQEQPLATRQLAQPFVRIEDVAVDVVRIALTSEDAADERGELVRPGGR